MSITHSILHFLPRFLAFFLPKMIAERTPVEFDKSGFLKYFHLSLSNITSLIYVVSFQLLLEPSSNSCFLDISAKMHIA